jgi:hypothetical protein
LLPFWSALLAYTLFPPLLEGLMKLIKASCQSSFDLFLMFAHFIWVLKSLALNLLMFFMWAIQYVGVSRASYMKSNSTCDMFSRWFVRVPVMQDVVFL